VVPKTLQKLEPGLNFKIPLTMDNSMVIEPLKINERMQQARKFSIDKRSSPSQAFKGTPSPERNEEEEGK